MTPKHFSPMMVALLVLAATVAMAQTNQARLMGVVTDGSGGSLPGVTVTVAAGNTRPASLVTDGSGRYLTAWLPPGTYAITFSLSGFETRAVNGIRLGSGETVVLDQQLSLASLTETVEVTAPAPAPAPAPPVIYQRTPPPPRPQAKPVDKEILASVCGPRQATEFSQAIGKILSHRDDDRRLMGPGDLLRIDAGENQGAVIGRNFVVRRRFQTGDRFATKKLATFAEQSAGLIQIVEAHADSAVALVVYVCGELYAGDTVEPYIPQPAFFAVAQGTPRFDEPARITTAADGQTAASAGQMMVIDRGIMQGVQRGQQVTIFRRPHGDLMPLTIGGGVIVSVRADSATVRLDRVTDAVLVGDLVALHR